MSGLKWVIFVLAALLGAARAGGQTTATVRSSAVAPAGGPIMLGQIADISGPQTDVLAGLVIVSPPDAAKSVNAAGWMRIDIDAVRAAVEGRAGIASGSVALRGGECWVKYGGAKAPAGTSAASAAAASNVSPSGNTTSANVENSGAPRSAGGGARTAAALTGPASPTSTDRPFLAAVDAPMGTILELIARQLANDYGVASGDLRLRPAAAGTEESVFLTKPIVAGERVEMQPMGAVTSGRVAIKVEVFIRERLTEVKTVSVEPVVRRQVVVASQVLGRDQAISSAATAVDERWLSPSDAAPLGLEQVMGANTRRRIEAGQIITAADVQPPVVVERGEEIWVQCVSGGVYVKIKARAQASARDGELVELKKDGAKTSFMARMHGHGVAVMTLGADAPAAYDAPPAESFKPLRRPNSRRGGT